jgi:hypothetical protein
MPTVRSFSWKTVLLTLLILAALGGFTYEMGAANFFSTIMETAHDLLLNTVFFILALAVLAGALGGFMAEFGILAFLNWLLAPFIRLLWGLPGAASIGAVTTFISDNPAIIALGKDEEFIKYFREHQKPALTNFGTSFGMGLIVIAFMMSQGFFAASFIGFLGAVAGSIVSTRLMLFFSRRSLGTGPATDHPHGPDPKQYIQTREIRDGNLFQRVLESLLEGGKKGLEIGFQIIPGVLVICTMILMVTFGAGDAGYDGSAYQGIPLLPELGRLIYLPMQWLFGFSSPDAIAFPITSLGAVGAAMGIVPKFLSAGLISGNDIAVFTAMGMCWSGFLSTHVAMMDVMGFRRLTSKAMISHAAGGTAAGIAAHLFYLLIL